MYYELRRYTTRLDAAAAFVERFETELVPVLEDHGFHLVGAWTIEVGDGSGADLLWMLRWDDLAAREAAYASVRADDRNDAFRDAMLGSLVSTSSQLLRPTRFSPLP